MSVTVDLRKVKPTAVHTIRRADRPLSLMCKSCQKELRQIAEGDVYFVQTVGQCSCSWGCCDTAIPRNRGHDIHLIYVDMESGEVMT